MMYKLPKLSTTQINNVFLEYEDQGGNHLNEKLTKLFKAFQDHDDEYDTLIKVATLNKIYSTNMRSLGPMVDNIVNAIGKSKLDSLKTQEYVKLVDIISITDHGNHKGKRKIIRNLSFASKYIHFISNNQTPILDAYIWIMMQGYLHQTFGRKAKRTQPKTYHNFYEQFCRFKKAMKLESTSNYKLDKVLWYMGKQRFDHYKNQGHGRSTCLRMMRDELVTSIK